MQKKEYRKKLSKKIKKGLDFRALMCYNSSVHLGVAQLVARYLGVVEAASSSLVTQTKNPKQTLVCLGFFDFSENI